MNDIDKLWSNAAKVECYVLALEAARAGTFDKAEGLSNLCHRWTGGEVPFRNALTVYGFTTAEIDRIIHRAHARADGRETITVQKRYRVKLDDGRYVPARDGEQPTLDVLGAACMERPCDAAEEASFWKNAYAVPVRHTLRHVRRVEKA